MSPGPKSASQHAPLPAAGTESTRTEAVRGMNGVLEKFEGKAREICGTNVAKARPAGIHPVEFAAHDWAVHVAPGSVLLTFEVHGDKFVRVRLPRAVARRCLRAVGEFLDHPELEPSSAPRPLNGRHPQPEIRKPYVRLAADRLVEAWERYKSGQATLSEIAADLGSSDWPLKAAFLRMHPREYPLVARCYKGFSPSVAYRKARIDAALERLNGLRAPITKPNGSVL